MRESRPILPIILGAAIFGILSGRFIVPGGSEGRQPQGRPASTEVAVQEQTIDNAHLQPYLAISEVHNLIVTVPDPAGGRFGHTFDLTIDAIERAMSRCRFTPVRHEIPWKRKDSESPPAPPGSWGEGQISGWLAGLGAWTGRVTVSPGGRHELVGRIAFYREKHLCLVYLVPETPINGINVQAFRDCLDRIQSHSTSPGVWHPAAQTVRIMAPRYSGSADSLAMILKALNDNGTNIDLISGTATSVRDQFNNLNHTSFCSTVHRDSLKRRAVYEYLSRYSRGSIALVSERSGFGGSWRRDEEKLPLEVDHIPYPLHVACARAALEGDAQGSETKLNLFRDVRHRLTVPTEDDASSPDIVPPFCPRMTAAYFEMVFSQAVSKLPPKGVDWIGILGTDIRDIIFLAKLVRANSPDARLFFLESDALLAHPELSEVLRGSLVFGSYPLSLTAPDKYMPPSRRIAFASQAQEGVYNAMLALMIHEFEHRPLPEPEEKTWPTEWAREMLDYDHAACSETAADESIWVSMVGSGELWPLEQLPLRKHPPKEEYLYVRPAQANDSRDEAASISVGQSKWLPIPAWLTMAGLTVLLVMNVAALTCRAPRVPADAGLGWWRPWIGPWWLGPEPRRQQIAWGCGAVAVLASVLLYMLYLATAGVYRLPFVVPFLVPVPLILLLLAAGLAYQAIAGHMEWLSRPAAITAALVLTTAMIVARGVLFQSNPGLPYLAHRAFKMTGGVSPVVTVVLLGLALYLCCLTELKRSWLNKRFPQKPPWPKMTEFNIFREASERAAGISSRAFHPPWLWIVPGLGTLILALLLGDRMGLTLEGRTYDTFISLAMLAVVFLCLWTLARFWGMWRSVRRMLRALAWSPIVGTLDSLPEKVSQAIGPYFFARKPRSFQLRTILCHLAQLHPAKARKHISDYAAALQEESDTGEFAGAQLLSQCMQELAADWQELGSSWDRYSPRDYCPDPPSEKDREEHPRRKESPGETSLATCLVWYIAHWFVHLRNLLIFMTLGSLLLLLAIDSYPFQPHRVLVMVPWLMILAIALTVLVVFVQVDRDEVVSRITKTRPNRLSFNRHFLGAVATFVLPLLVVVASQFPEVSGVLSKWMTPLVGSLQ